MIAIFSSRMADEVYVAASSAYDDGIDRQRMRHGEVAHLPDRPIKPLRIALQYIHQHVGVDEHHQSSPRSNAINSSVRHLMSAVPAT